MAKVIRKGKDLEQEYISEFHKKKSGIKAYLIYLAAAAAFLLAMYSSAAGGNKTTEFFFKPCFIGLAVVAVIWLIIYLANRDRGSDVKKNILAAGIEGEKQTANLLSFLPKDYTVYQDVRVPFKGKTSEVDNIVVGKKGVFIIETKNLNGDISGRIEDTYWTQTKVGRGGTPYSSEFYSPVKQVGTHIYRLANYLRANGVDVYVKGMVYFTNADSVIHINGSKKDISVYSSHAGDEPNMYKEIILSPGEIEPKTLSRINQLISRL